MAEPTTTDIMNAIVDLHGAMQHGFVRMETRLESVEVRLENVDVRLENVEGRLENVEGRLENVEVRLTSVEGEVRGVRSWMERCDQRFEALERKVL